MFKTIKNAWSIPDLRKKILFTLLIIVIFRIGSVIPVPFLDMTALSQLTFGGGDAATNSIFAYLNTMSGGAFGNATIFAMGITPYINSSIIMQLLCVAIPALERLSKEGEDGRKKIATITRYLTVVLGLIQGTAYFFYLKGQRILTGDVAVWFAAIVIILIFTAGTAFMMWLGEQINTKGIGNGISILLFAGIVARLPMTIYYLFPLNKNIPSYWSMASQYGQIQYYFLVPAFIILFLIVIWIINFMQDAERRIPIQYAKRVVGRKMYGGQSSHMPIKVALGGVMPVIFATSILSIPSTIRAFWTPAAGSFWDGFFRALSPSGWLYIVLEFVLVLAFAYFYTQIQYNPVEMANNLKQNNGTIPGIRPGQPTAEFIRKILSRITLIGALFLSFIAIVPSIFTMVGNMQNLSMGGTSVIIMVGVAIETVKQMESQMMMRHYRGFLD
ncbi:MAG: preprotein translocase subunit SecY [Clostridia bacterium]|nr:preprotein translocase subunit SecY [Clostridia bacterium]